METPQITAPRLKPLAGLALTLLFAMGIQLDSNVQPALTVEQQAVMRAVSDGNGAALTLLERVVNINSGTLNLDGVRQVGQVFRSELDALGFTTRWVDGAAWGRAGHLIADHPGSGPRMLLIGHLDTVFEKDSPFQRFERIDEHTARGPGIIDMKGGDVIIVSALKALKAAGALARMNVVVVMNGDEELSGAPLALARATLVTAANGARVAIGFEDGPGDPRFAVTARRSASGWDLVVKGTPAHSSQVFREDIGYGAIFEAARILNGFRERLAGQPHLTFNPGAILGGTAVAYDAGTESGTASGKSNVIAEHARVTGDIRALSREQLEKARETMVEVVRGSLAGTAATLTFDDGYPPMAPTEGNARLLALYNQASMIIGAGPVTAVDPDRAGAADVSFIADRVPMIIDGIGMPGRDGHTVNETADLSKLPSQTGRAALLLLAVER
jgi:glutamate carboxypeptidase